MNVQTKTTTFTVFGLGLVLALLTFVFTPNKANANSTYEESDVNFEGEVSDLPQQIKIFYFTSSPEGCEEVQNKINAWMMEGKDTRRIISHDLVKGYDNGMLVVYHYWNIPPPAPKKAPEAPKKK